MTTLFCVRPATGNIGNDLINRATTDLMQETFGPDISIVNVPALAANGHGGLTRRQVYDMNRLADGVVVGGGNLFENGELTVDLNALATLQPPLALLGLSHGRIHGRDMALIERTDCLPASTIQVLRDRAVVSLVRDHVSLQRLQEIPGTGRTELGGCPTMFFPANPPDQQRIQRVLLSIRNPQRMNVPPPLQWRIFEDVRRLILALQERGLGPVQLVCHDYRDLEFAAGFPEVRTLYFDNVERYIAALRSCSLSVTYRLHAFLPCLAFGTPSVNLSYDERAREMVATSGMSAWDIDATLDHDIVDAVMDRVSAVDTYQYLRSAAQPTINRLHDVTMTALRRFAEAVNPEHKSLQK